MTNDNRTPEEIEREIERERAGLTSTLDDLQNKFSVETIARQFSDQFREHGGDIGRSVTDAVKRNPIALALTGAGLAWLMAGDRAPSRDRIGTRDSYDHRDPRNRANYYGDRDDHSGLPVAAQQHSVIPAGQRRDLGPQPGDLSKPYYSGEVARSGDVPSWARHDDDDHTPGLAQRAGDAASRTGDRVGAAIGAALPRSRTEDRYMGQHRDQLMADAERIFAEEKSKLGKVAQAASDEAKKVLRETKEDADAAAPGASAADAFVEKAKASGQRVVDAAEAEADKQKVGEIKKS